jgi:hypothetical protein
VRGREDDSAADSRGPIAISRRQQLAVSAEGEATHIGVAQGDFLFRTITSHERRPITFGQAEPLLAARGAGG